jgi:hypothetical protein
MPLECMISKTNNGWDFPIAATPQSATFSSTRLPIRPEQCCSFPSKNSEKLRFLDLEERSNRLRALYGNHLEKFLSF